MISFVAHLLRLVYAVETNAEQVRSLMLDVKIWEPSIMSLLESLGNVYANSIWEELLNPKSVCQYDGMPIRLGIFTIASDRHLLKRITCL